MSRILEGHKEEDRELTRRPDDSIERLLVGRIGTSKLLIRLEQRSPGLFTNETTDRRCRASD